MLPSPYIQGWVFGSHGHEAKSGHGTHHIKHFSWLNVPHISPPGTEFAFGEQTAKWVSLRLQLMVLHLCTWVCLKYAICSGPSAKNVLTEICWQNVSRRKMCHLMLKRFNTWGGNLKQVSSSQLTSVTGKK